MIHFKSILGAPRRWRAIDMGASPANTCASDVEFAILSTLVMRLPKEKLIFVVDTVPVGVFPGRGMIDFHPFETEAFMKKLLALDWERLIPGHPGRRMTGSAEKEDVEEQLTLLRDASAEMKKLAQDGKCWDTAEKEFKLPKYESWPGYAAGPPFVARRYCGLWGRGT